MDEFWGFCEGLPQVFLYGVLNVNSTGIKIRTMDQEEYCLIDLQLKDYQPDPNTAELYFPVVDLGKIPFLSENYGLTLSINEESLIATNCYETLKIEKVYGSPRDMHLDDLHAIKYDESITLYTEHDDSNLLKHGLKAIPTTDAMFRSNRRGFFLRRHTKPYYELKLSKEKYKNVEVCFLGYYLNNILEPIVNFLKKVTIHIKEENPIKIEGQTNYFVFELYLAPDSIESKYHGG
ncbi:MAG: hypothetical protein ACOC44_12385 [Promethearchaeia archaeon]